MSMWLNNTQCCAVKEIAKLSDHKSPHEAMIAFCKQHRSYGDSLSDPGGHIIFTGVTGISKGSRDIYIPYTQVKMTFEYGPAFAAFIKKNKLGSVHESVVRKNRVNHPTHSVRVWIWSPSVKALKAWWAKHKNE